MTPKSLIPNADVKSPSEGGTSNGRTWYWTDKAALRSRKAASCEADPERGVTGVNTRSLRPHPVRSSTSARSHGARGREAGAETEGVTMTVPPRERRSELGA